MYLVPIIKSNPLIQPKSQITFRLNQKHYILKKPTKLHSTPKNNKSPLSSSGFDDQKSTPPWNFGFQCNER